MRTKCVTQDIVKANYIRLECRECKGALEVNRSVNEDLACPFCGRGFQRDAIEIVNVIFKGRHELNKMGADKVSLVSYEE